ncbi:MAG: Mov34/MPN/PAD-1 family protein [Candidatus Thorarchaeota archaeon]
MATIKMSHEAYKEIMNSICARPAESGGILLGPIGTNEVTHFYFDRGANCTRATYSPDHITLNKKMKEEWLPAGIDMKGFVHSHPGLLDRLTLGDLAYIKRLLNTNSDMEFFIAPIVIPGEYRMRPMIVGKQDCYQPRAARIELF